MDVEIKGEWDPQFQSLVDAFNENFEEDLEVGSSCAITINGKFVVDIWAGFKDEEKTQPWERDTLVNVYSSTKVITTICVHLLIDRGLIDVEKPVAEYWPEFAQNGKEKLLVKYILSHTSGLPGWDEPLVEEDLYDWDRMTSLLASQKPWWEPGTQSAYHSITHGFLLGHLVRCVTGKTLGTFFREEIAEPLGADFHIGLPEEQDHRVSCLIPPPKKNTNWSVPSKLLSIPEKILFNPIQTHAPLCTREWLGAELPSDNGQGNARSMALIGSIIACGGTMDGIKFLSSTTIDKALKEQIYGTDLLLGPMRWGLGWGLPSKENRITPDWETKKACYWGGWGGSRILMDLDEKMCFTYAMNKMIESQRGDARTNKLNRILYECLDEPI